MWKMCSLRHGSVTRGAAEEHFHQRCLAEEEAEALEVENYTA